MSGWACRWAPGIASHERRFGGWGGGFWLPECAYEPGLERRLAGHGVRAFCVDQTAAHGLGAPEQLEPVRTEAGPVAVPIDWQTVELVWHDTRGYPTHSVYRDYHARTVHDLKPWNNGGGAYDHGEALRLADEHAADFVRRVAARLRGYEQERGRPGLLCCALDTELLGHWWYEGPAWLRAVLREAGAAGVELVTLSEGLERVEPVEGRALARSSWGTGKDLSTWDSAKVADLAFAARTAELHTVHELALRTEPRRGGWNARCASCWPSSRATGPSWRRASWRPITRTSACGDHGSAHAAALAALAGSGPVPEPSVRNLAPHLAGHPA